MGFCDIVEYCTTAQQSFEKKIGHACCIKWWQKKNRNGVEKFEVELSLILEVDFIYDKGLEAKTTKTKEEKKEFLKWGCY